MLVSRRNFLTILGATTLPLITGCTGAGGEDDTGSTEQGLLRTVKLAPLPLGTTPVIWLQGSSCSGCSVSFLNRISTSAPVDAKDVLLDIIDLRYHSTLMASAGETAAQAAESVYSSSSYLLVVEGAVPTGAAGKYCGVFTLAGKEYTVQELVARYGAKAKAVIAAGTCAAFGGIAAIAPNPTGASPVSSITKAPLVNVPGCPTHPDWLVWTIYQLLTGASISLDSSGRPTDLFNGSVHNRCPRRNQPRASALGQDLRCQKQLGCKGPVTSAACPNLKFNNGANWCVDGNTPCIGCVEPGFPAVGMLPA